MLSSDEGELELLLSLDGAEYEMAPGVIVEFTVRRTTITPQRPTASATPWCSGESGEARRGSGSITRTRSHKAAEGAGALSMTTGTGQRRMVADLMRSPRH